MFLCFSSFQLLSLVPEVSLPVSHPLAKKKERHVMGRLVGRDRLVNVNGRPKFLDSISDGTGEETSG